MKAKEHLKKIKGTIDVERGYSLGTVFTTRNKQYMYDTGTGKVFECGANEYQILKSLFEETSLPEKVEGFSEEELEAAVIRQIKRCLFRQIKTGLSEHLTMG